MKKIKSCLCGVWIFCLAVLPQALALAVPERAWISGGAAASIVDAHLTARELQGALENVRTRGTPSKNNPMVRILQWGTVKHGLVTLTVKEFESARLTLTQPRLSQVISAEIRPLSESAAIVKWRATKMPRAKINTAAHFKPLIQMVLKGIGRMR